MDRLIPANIHVSEGRDVRISSIGPNKWCMHFRAFGVENPRQPESIDAAEYICSFTKSELFLFQQVYKHTKESNNLTLRPKSYSPAELAKLRTAIPLWIEKGLLKRIKREYYMVNPWFLPPRSEQLAEMDRWRVLKSC